MNKTAYLLGTLDISAEPAVFMGTWICGEANPTTDLKRRHHFVIASATGKNYEVAERMLLSMLKEQEFGHFGWAFHALKDR